MTDAAPAFESAACPAGVHMAELPAHYAPEVFDFDAWKARTGFIRDEDVARELDVSRGTLFNWKKAGFGRIPLLALYTLEHMPEARCWIARPAKPERRAP